MNTLLKIEDVASRDSLENWNLILRSFFVSFPKSEKRTFVKKLFSAALFHSLYVFLFQPKLFFYTIVSSADYLIFFFFIFLLFLQKWGGSSMCFLSWKKNRQKIFDFRKKSSKMAFWVVDTGAASKTRLTQIQVTTETSKQKTRKKNNIIFFCSTFLFLVEWFFVDCALSYINVFCVYFTSC